jgi:hypothetical protein
MTTHTRMTRRLIVGIAGASLIVALFLPWATLQGTDRTCWQDWTTAAALCAIVAACAVTTAITGGRFGLFRPDLSLIGATDLLSVIATLTLGWLILFGFPQQASRQPGVILALISAAVIAGAVGDYRPLRGAPLFPRRAGC